MVINYNDIVEIGDYPISNLGLVMKRQSETLRSMVREASRYPSQGPGL